ncbi:peptidyl-prolyl cis-trans isomerase SurA [Mariprofundus micogutta]|uniref:Chaperone SurA n=1 Tax=Mariprofundus micogutta TaxID=1921010 RepID=A0A1L8CM40_9PROT|nr:peptidylprolyl isomerase [Mariprofundus micogutta]GAV19955.1 peptidyl-prolyl cis-trans isomerase SurA [Mariprofundus micogutta]
MRFLILLTSLLTFISAAKAETFDSIAAIVNNEAISCYEVQREIQTAVAQIRQSGQSSPLSYNDLKQRAFDGKIDKLLQVQEARKLELSVTNEEFDNAVRDIESRNNLLPGQLKEAIEQQGMDFEDYKETLKDQMLIGKLINTGVRSKLNISEEAMKEYHRKYLADPKPRREVRLAQIFLSVPNEPTPEQLSKVRDKVRQIHQQLVEGKDFTQMVTNYSQSAEVEQQGVMGWFMHGGISQRFASALDLPVNGITDPIRAPAGFHIIKVLEERWQDPEQMGESYYEAHARHILLQIPPLADESTEAKIRQRAEVIAREMNGATDEEFAARAEEESQGPSASKGGDLGWFKKGMMIPEFEEAAFKLKAGETSGVVETSFGLHIIRVINQRHIDPNSFEAHRDNIQQILTNSAMQEQLPRWLAGLKASASIEKFSCEGISRERATAPQIQPEVQKAETQTTPEAVVESWRKAWSSKDLEAYLANYSDHFHVGKSHTSIAAWKTYRKEMIENKAYIRISISNLKLTAVDDKHVRCEFTQDYKSDIYSSRDKKALVLEKEGNSWKIIRELTFL